MLNELLELRATSEELRNCVAWYEDQVAGLGGLLAAKASKPALEAAIRGLVNTADLNPPGAEPTAQGAARPGGARSRATVGMDLIG